MKHTIKYILVSMAIIFCFHGMSSFAQPRLVPMAQYERMGKIDSVDLSTMSITINGKKYHISSQATIYSPRSPVPFSVSSGYLKRGMKVGIKMGTSDSNKNPIITSIMVFEENGH